jgi:hypothetical protein
MARVLLNTVLYVALVLMLFNVGYALLLAIWTHYMPPTPAFDHSEKATTLFFLFFFFSAVRFSTPNRTVLHSLMFITSLNSNN